MNLINEFVQVRNDLADFVQVFPKAAAVKNNSYFFDKREYPRAEISDIRACTSCLVSRPSRVFRIRTRFARRPSTFPLLARFFIYFLMLNSWLGSDGCSRLRSRWNSRTECVPRAASRLFAICVECTSFSARASRKRCAKIVPSCSRRREMMDIFRERRLSRQCFKRVTSQRILCSLHLALSLSLSLYSQFRISKFVCD